MFDICEERILRAGLKEEILRRNENRAATLHLLTEILSTSDTAGITIGYLFGAVANVPIEIVDAMCDFADIIIPIQDIRATVCLAYCSDHDIPIYKITGLAWIRNIRWKEMCELILTGHSPILSIVIEQILPYKRIQIKDEKRIAEYIQSEIYRAIYDRLNRAAV